MHYSFADICKILGGAGQIVRPEAPVRHLLTDSRNIVFPEESLFFAIRGRNHDGHQFIGQAYHEGVRNFIVEATPEIGLPEANYIVTASAIDALQTIAAFHRRQFSFPVVGITGSNGKTIVKEWIYHLLKIQFDIARSPKSYNSQIGVPLSVWQLDEKNDLAIIEAGISLPGEMQSLENMIHPTIGVITNLGKAHQEGFENDPEKLNEKIKLFRHCNTIIYRKDDHRIDTAIHQQYASAHLISWSTDEALHPIVLIKDIEQLPGETLFTMNWKQQPLHIKIPFTDNASFENAVHALITALLIEISLHSSAGQNIGLITEQAATLPVISMRLELKKGIHNNLLINDVYSADLNSLAIALHFLKQQGEGYDKTVILSDFDESGEAETVLYEKVAGLLEANHIDHFYGVGERISASRNVFHHLHAVFFPSTEALISGFDANSFTNQVILIKGARRFRLERISNLLALKTHATVLRIYLHHLVHNLNTYRSLLKPGVKVMAMVKAFSYGSGQAEIARVLAHNRVDYLAVAYADEGVDLRRQGIRTPIMVMNPEPDTFGQMAEYDLEPEIYSFRILDLFLEHIQLKNKIFLVHLKLDTGMHRLGFNEQDIPQLIAAIQQHQGIRIASIFSHVSSADETKHDDFTNTQIRLFDQLSSAITATLSYPVTRHLLNSPGISRFPHGQFDMIRLGIGLYGVDPSAMIQNRLQYVSSLHTVISQIRQVAAGESVGYGRAFIADRPMRIATLNIGYADGFSRRLGNGRGKVWINGRYATVAGRVCMDMVMVDITDIQDVKEGDEVEIFGEHIPVSDYAAWQDTIPYEIMTGISQRVKRIYLQE